MITRQFCFVCKGMICQIMTRSGVPEVFDFCLGCKDLMTLDFERQMVGLPPLPLWLLGTNRVVLTEELDRKHLRSRAISADFLVRLFTQLVQKAKRRQVHGKWYPIL